MMWLKTLYFISNALKLFMEFKYSLPSKFEPSLHPEADSVSLIYQGLPEPVSEVMYFNLYFNLKLKFN